MKSCKLTCIYIKKSNLYSFRFDSISHIFYLPALVSIILILKFEIWWGFKSARKFWTSAFGRRKIWNFITKCSVHTIFGNLLDSWVMCLLNFYKTLATNEIMRAWAVCHFLCALLGNDTLLLLENFIIMHIQKPEFLTLWYNLKKSS